MDKELRQRAIQAIRESLPGIAAVEEGGDGLRRVQHSPGEGIQEKNSGLGQDLSSDQILFVLRQDIKERL